MDILFGVGQRFVLRIKPGIFGTRNRIIRITLGLWIFVDYACFLMHLPSQILEFGDPRERLVLRIIYDRRFLIYLNVVGLVTKFERAVRKLPVLIIEKRIDRSRVDHLIVF